MSKQACLRPKTVQKHVLQLYMLQINECVLLNNMDLAFLNAINDGSCLVMHALHTTTQAL